MKNRTWWILPALACVAVYSGCEKPAGSPPVENVGYQGKPAAHWIQQLDPGRSSSDRAGAIKALGAIGPEAKAAVPALIECMKDEELRPMAILALGSMGPEARAAIPELIAALKDRDDRVRSRAAAALSRIGPEAVPQLVAEVQEDKDKIEPCQLDDTWFDELVRENPSLVICGLTLLGLASLATLLQITRLWIRHRERVARISMGLDPDKEISRGEGEKKEKTPA
jgi:hypothetical protein